jgi:hypothetical protein
MKLNPFKQCELYRESPVLENKLRAEIKYSAMSESDQEVII